MLPGTPRSSLLALALSLALSRAVIFISFIVSPLVLHKLAAARRMKWRWFA